MRIISLTLTCLFSSSTEIFLVSLCFSLGTRQIFHFKFRLFSHCSSRCRLRCGFGRSFHRRHLCLTQRHPQQTRLPPLHHGNGHLQHPGRLSGGYGHDNQGEPGGSVTPVTARGSEQPEKETSVDSQCCQLLDV